MSKEMLNEHSVVGSAVPVIVGAAAGAIPDEVVSFAWRMFGVFIAGFLYAMSQYIWQRFRLRYLKKADS